MRFGVLDLKHNYRKLELSDSAKNIFSYIAYFTGGFLMAECSAFGTYSPFGISMTAALRFPGALLSFFGSVLGYIIFPHSGGSFRYIAAMIAVLTIRWTLNDLKKLNSHSFYSVAVCFFPIIATGLAMMSVSGFSGKSALMYFIEAVLGGAFAFFISRTFIIINGTKSLGMLLPQEAACLVITGCVGILSLVGISLGPVSVGRIIAVLAVFFSARYGGLVGGTTAGIAAGMIMGLYSAEYAFLAAAYSFGGLMAGLFAPVGRIAETLIFLLSAVIASIQLGSTENIIQLIYEVMIAGIIFNILPKDTFHFISAVFASQSSDTHCEGLRKSIIMRLNFASKALSNVSNDVEEVSKKLSKIITPSMDSVYQNSVDTACCRCGMKVFCWEHKDGMSMEYFDHITEKLRQNGKIQPQDFIDDFKRKCCRTSDMASAVNKCYKSFLAGEAAERRVDEVRAVVAGQFCGLGDILGEMAEEYENYEFFENELAEQITMRLKDYGLHPTDTSCRIDYLGRMTVEAETADNDIRAVKKTRLVKDISKICGRKFDEPIVSSVFGVSRIAMCECPCFEVEIASSQHVCGDGQLCGDHFRYFQDGSGRMIAIISDGMGTGGRAAVDGGMASSIMEKLIKAGLGFDCSLKVVNAALMVKSGDESLATLDVISIDLYNGLTDFMKAGAAISFLKKGGDMYRVETPSLPVGILPQVEFTYTEDCLGEDDIIVMLSDGAIATGEDWIERIISTWGDRSMQELADTINDEATARRSDGHDDDITVIAMQIKPVH